jgi:hypothetical protein
MASPHSIEIALSKNKLTKIIITSAVFVAIGIWMVVSKHSSNNRIFGSPTVVVVMGIISILFFGTIGFLVLKKMKDNTPGLVIDETGITDNASGVAAGHIPWADINEIKITQVFAQKFLMIIVKKPEEYITT